MPPQPKVTKKSERYYIQHNYHDHSQGTPSSKEDFGVLQSQTGRYRQDTLSGTKTSNKKYGQAKSFPVKLYELLDNAEANGLYDVISWKIHGRAFFS
jgi:hypothetical protein